ncbi:CinA family protein [Schaalia vaccimaxillae]|uniref:CinA family protein n=1 Tax=Schaalia vaccimaxillae TaxID=183916 RepID=UPI0003B52FE2|nr:CinA family protein [Schaalia vaccimaxillae]
MTDDELAAVLEKMASQGWTLAVAESLTGGALSARIVDITGASRVLRGSVCTYATDLKAQILGVPEERLEAVGPVDGEVAQAMASGVRKLMNADVGIATTGVAGPGQSDGHRAGTVYVALSHDQDSTSQLLDLSGGRSMVRRLTVDAALRMLADFLGVHLRQS